MPSIVPSCWPPFLLLILFASTVAGCTNSVADTMSKCEQEASGVFGQARVQLSSRQEYEYCFACLRSRGFELDWDMAHKHSALLQSKSRLAYFELIWDEKFWRRDYVRYGH